MIIVINFEVEMEKQILAYRDGIRSVGNYARAYSILERVDKDEEDFSFGNSMHGVRAVCLQ